MPSDATSDQAIDALQRQLASSRQLASRLENELSNAKSDLATSRLKLANSQAELQNSRAALQKERNRPEPPPPPPPPPPPRPISPGYERAKAAAPMRIVNRKHAKLALSRREIVGRQNASDASNAFHSEEVFHTSRP